MYIFIYKCICTYIYIYIRKYRASSKAIRTCEVIKATSINIYMCMYIYICVYEYMIMYMHVY